MLKQLKSVSMLLFLLTMSVEAAYPETGESTLKVSVVQQGTTCKGVVKDAAGETIIGASVVAKGTTNGTITGINGDFSLNNVKNRRYYCSLFCWLSDSRNQIHRTIIEYHP